MQGIISYIIHILLMHINANIIFRMHYWKHVFSDITSDMCQWKNFTQKNKWLSFTHSYLAGLATFLPAWSWTSALAIVMVSVFATFIHVALANFLAPYGLPVLTMPFNLSTIIFLFGALDYNWYQVSFTGAFLNSIQK